MGTLPSGQIIPSAPALYIPQAQKVTGSFIGAATDATMKANATNVSAIKNLGAGQKGSSRRKRTKRSKHNKNSKRRKLRGGVNMNVAPSFVPSANSISGVSHEGVHIKGVDALNQLRASSTFDKLANAQPYKLGGFRLNDGEDLYPGSGTQEDTKGSRKTKKHGRRRNRSHMGKRSKSNRSRRRSRRNTH
jgi:hypothetical protein